MNQRVLAEDAFSIAWRKAVKDRKDQLVWKEKAGKLRTELFTQDGIKSALLATGTQGYFWRIAANDGTGMIVRWSLSILMLRNCRRGYDGPRMADWNTNPNREPTVSDTPEATCIPKMQPDKAQEIARSLKWLAQSYAEAGMVRDATRAERDSQCWMTYSISLAQMRPTEPSP